VAEYKEVPYLYHIPKKDDFLIEVVFFILQNLIDIIMEAKNYTITEMAEPT